FYSSLIARLESRPLADLRVPSERIRCLRRDVLVDERLCILSMRITANHAGIQLDVIVRGLTRHVEPQCAVQPSAIWAISANRHARTKVLGRVNVLPEARGDRASAELGRSATQK